MGAFVFGYQLSSYGNLSQLILAANVTEDGDEPGNTLLLLNTILALSAIFGTRSTT
jgi:hypothetical protein